MQKSCPNCGAETFPGVRFCRRCGAAVYGAGNEGTGDVSPQAATVPLEPVEGRTTEGLAPESGRASADTARVSIAEMERLLRAQQDATTPPAPTSPSVPDPNATLVNNNATLVNHSAAATRPEAPIANDDHDEELTITVPRPTQTRETTIGSESSKDFKTNADSELSTDFETTADFDATRPADLEATRPASSAQLRQATRDASVFEEESINGNAPGRVQSRIDATPAHSQSHGEDVTVRITEPIADARRTESSIIGRRIEAPVIAGRNEPTAAGAGGARVPVAKQRRAWPLVVAICAAVLIVAVGGAWLAFKLSRRPTVTDMPTQPPAAPVAADAGQQFEEKLAEAESLLAQGNMEGALERLREANLIDPANTRAHRRLGELLLSSGARREAIEELRAVARNAPEDFTAWRQLAAAQFTEGLYADATESYRRLVALVGGESAADPNDLLSYADALRLSGHADEARTAYQRLASGPASDVSAIARQRLAELAQQAQPTPAPTTRAGEQTAEHTTREGETASITSPVAQPTPLQPTPAPTQPTPTPPPARPAEASPAEHYSRGSGLWSSNRAAALEEFRAAASGGNMDAHYYLGLSYVEGKNLHALQRAEVVAALQHFQLAQRGRQYVAESRHYEQQLEKEFDRLRKQ
jgi:tetratricopeptide (TPR) repeat protein